MSDLTKLPDEVIVDENGVSWTTERWVDKDGVVRQENTYPTKK